MKTICKISCSSRKNRSFFREAISLTKEKASMGRRVVEALNEAQYLREIFHLAEETKTKGRVYASKRAGIHQQFGGGLGRRQTP